MKGKGYRLYGSTGNYTSSIITIAIEEYLRANKERAGGEYLHRRLQRGKRKIQHWFAARRIPVCSPSLQRATAHLILRDILRDTKILPISSHAVEPRLLGGVFRI
jgi:hypothetical protein